MLEVGSWSWLEVAKLVASLMIPATMAIFGVYLHRITKRFEHIQWRSQKLIEKRLAIYDDLAPLLNDLLCYFTYVGGWRDMNPPEIIALKRKIDKKIYLAAPLYSKEFFDACMYFQSACFETYGGWGRDATLRTEIQYRKDARSDWKSEWDGLFSSKPTAPEVIDHAYYRVMNVMAKDIGVSNLS